MSEVSRIESSFGPVRLAERSDTYEGSWDNVCTNLLSPRPRNGRAGF
jgi:hypothetical protein